MFASSGECRRRRRLTRAIRSRSRTEQAAAAICWPLRREIAAELWHRTIVDSGGFARRADFKRMFEAIGGCRVKFRPHLT